MERATSRFYAFALLQCFLAVLVLLAGCGPALSSHRAQAVAILTPFPSTVRADLAGLSFYATQYTLGDWPDPRGPYWPRPADYDGPRDASGVRVFIRDGITYQQPVTQAMDGLWALAIYRDNSAHKDALQLALKEAKRLVENHIEDAYETGTAWWFPFPFDFALYGDPTEVVHTPWYSGMAQGVALDLFTQLYKATGDVQWENAADRTFDSFLYPYRPGSTGPHTPWVWRVDESGYAWIEEYPMPRPDDNTINGFGFALWGLISYVRAFHDARALQLVDGGLTTFLHVIPLVRHPGEISSYSVSHLADRSIFYHKVVVGQLAVFSVVTGDTHFAAWAIALTCDAADEGFSLVLRTRVLFDCAVK